MRVLTITVILVLSEAVYAVEAIQKKPPRLKFKNGPVCMCTDGLSEKDIASSNAIQKGSDSDAVKRNQQQNKSSRRRDMEDE